MRQPHAVLVKKALLRELDHTLQRDFRQSLTEILTELKIRNADANPGASPDSIFTAIRQSRILECKSTLGTQQIRAALERFDVGKFGLCVRCGRRIQALELERNPLVETCPSCRGSRRPNSKDVR
jgi:RNA polymerase-binding transcription factor DksA